MMRRELLNLALFCRALGKAGMMTNFVPAVLLVYAAETWAKAFRVPARKLFRKVVRGGEGDQANLRPLRIGSRDVDARFGRCAERLADRIAV